MHIGIIVFERGTLYNHALCLSFRNNQKLILPKLRVR